MDAKNVGENLFLLNATVLLSHQIEAAYWQEWDMFYLPGGVQLFVILNIPIILLVFVGYKATVLGYRSGLAYTAALAGCGFFAVIFHVFYLANGDERFKTPVSLVLLCLTLVISAMQLAHFIKKRRD